MIDDDGVHPGIGTAWNAIGVISARRQEWRDATQAFDCAERQFQILERRRRRRPENAAEIIGESRPHSGGARTVAQNNQKSRRKYWATHLSVRSFTHTAHPLARSLNPELMGK